MRAEISLHPALQFTPALRPIFDALLETVPDAKEVHYEAATIGGIEGWWCIPANAMEDTAILYRHSGAYIVGSAAASRNLAGQIATRARAATFTTHYRLAPEHPFPAAIEDA